MWFSAGEDGNKIDLRLEQLGLGETIGSGIVRTVNEADPYAMKTYIALMGDPTLRLHVIAPATGLNGNDGTTVNLSWTASSDASGYFIYRSTNGLDGSWTRISTDAITSTSYTDSGAPSGAKTYQVRALKLIATGSGSYTNLSQGIFKSVN